MTIKQLTEVVNDSLTLSNQKLDADLVEISQTDGNVLTTVEDGLLVDTSSLATKIELQEILTTLGVTPPSEWELTNAYILNNYLTYISDGNPYGTLYARKSLGIGESVTIDFQFDLNRISGLRFAADDGTSMEGSYSSECAVILQDLTSAILIAQQDWNPDYKVYVNDSTSYKATIVRLAKSRVVLSMSDVEGNLLISRDVTIGTADINRVWLHVSLYGNPGDTISYGTNITVTPGGFASSASLDLKVDKEVGKTLTSNDYTDEDKTKLSNILPYEISGAVGSITSVYREDLADRTVFTVNTVNVEGQMNTRDPSHINSPKVNSVPLYSLNNEGEYVLTEPDSWVSFNQSSYVFPVYHLSSVDDSYVKGIVNFSIQLMEDHLRVNYEHNVKSIIDDYSLQAQSSLLRLRNEYLPLTFTSSLNGELVYGIFDVPLSTLADGESVQSLLDSMLNVGTKPIFEFSLKSVGKETVKVNQTLNMDGVENIPDSDFTKVTYIKTDTSSPMWVEAEYTPENINGELHIDWGDGAKEVLNIADFEAGGYIIYLVHEYAVNGEYVVKAYSTTQASYTCFGNITKVIDWGSPANLQPRFSSYNLIEVPSTLHPALTNLQYMFSNCTSFNQDISNWDVSNVTNMKQMFYNNYAFNQPIGNWNTSNVTDMYSMFGGCSLFDQDISTWDVSNVTNMYGMFWETASFSQPLNNWNTSNVNNMAAMFYNATSFNQDLNNWNVSNVTDMDSMFAYASAFDQDLSQWCVSEIASLPYEFDLNAINWTLPRPVWGTCPAP